jgi:hypothetical protein
MATALLLVVLAAGFCSSASTVVLLSQLKPTLEVTASPTTGQGTYAA